MKTAKEFRAEARTALTGKYWWAMLASLIAGLLGGTGGSVPSLNYNFDENNLDQLKSLFADNPEAGRVVLIIGGTILSFLAAAGVALFIIGGAVELGYNRFNVKLYDAGAKPNIADLFSQFSIFGKALGLRVLIALKIFAWSLLLIVPGIIAFYQYAMAPYLMAENPSLGVTEAIDQSKKLMDGHKWRLFCLGFSFIGWLLLACLTCGVGFVFLAPYIKAASTAFYLSSPAL